MTPYPARPGKSTGSAPQAAVRRAESQNAACLLEILQARPLLVIMEKIKYIIDTCILLRNKPLGKARRDAEKAGAVLIVPQKVHEELYGLMNNRKIRCAVMRAMQLVSQAKWGILPHHGEFRDGDDEIMSYCRSHPEDAVWVYTQDKRLAKAIRENCPNVRVAIS